MNTKLSLLLPTLTVLILLILLLLAALSPVCWFDEIITICESVLPYSEFINSLSTTDYYPPFYYYLIHLLALSLDIDITSPQILTLVLLLKVFSWGAIVFISIIIFSFFASLRNKKAGISCILLCFSLPYFLRYSCEIRPYSLCAIFVALAFLSAIKAFRDNNKKWWISYGLCIVATEYSHYYALITLSIISGVLFLYCLRHERKHIIPLVTANIAALVLFLPWLPTFLHQLHHVQAGWWNHDSLWKAPKYALLLCRPAYMGKLSYVFIAITWAISCNAIAKAYRKKDTLTLLCVCVGLLIIPATMGIAVINSLINGQAIIQPRYFYAGIIVYAIGASWATTYLSKRGQLLFSALLMVVAGFTMSNYIREEWHQHEKFTSIQSFIFQHKDLYVYMTDTDLTYKTYELAMAALPTKSIAPLFSSNSTLRENRDAYRFIYSLLGNNGVSCDEVHPPFKVILFSEKIPQFKDEAERFSWNYTITDTGNFHLIHVTSPRPETEQE